MGIEGQQRFSSHAQAIKASPDHSMLAPGSWHTGTALATAGEDGTVKIWSRNGMLRSTLSQNDSPVYSVVWAADSDQLCYSTGSNIVIKSIQSSAKQMAWRAHEGVVLKVDWSAINHMVVSAGEDCKYKVGGFC